MAELGLTVQIFIFIAGALNFLGFVVINQVALRLLLFSGTLAYIAYYAFALEVPLWDAIYLSTLIAAANMIGLASLMLHQSRLMIPRAHSDLYLQFSALPPGDFRALMKLANRRTLTDWTQATSEGQMANKLIFVISGSTQVTKAGDYFTLPPRTFIGEVAYLIDAPSSATTWLTPGSEVLEWRFDDLRRRSDRDPRFKMALNALVSQDLARKVSVAVAPSHAHWRPIKRGRPLSQTARAPENYALSSGSSIT